MAISGLSLRETSLNFFLGGSAMEYIIFLLTIQVPFLYLIWRFFQKRDSSRQKHMLSLKKQNEHIANFMDTLRMSVEKISEDVYGNGKVNSRMFYMEKGLNELKTRIRQMELYTGLRSSDKLESLSSSSTLKDKSFK